MEYGFFPDRWRNWRIALSVLLATGAVANLFAAVTAFSWSAAFGFVAFAISAFEQLRVGRRSGVTLDERGLTVRTFRWLGANGTWTWAELQAVELFQDRDVKNGPEQLGVRTKEGGMIRLGPAHRQAKLLERLRQVLPER